MVNSVFNSVFSLLASRNQQYKGVTAVAHHVRTFSDYYYIIIVINIVVVIIIIIIVTIIIIIITLFYFGKIIQNKIYYKNQARLQKQKAGQQKIIKTIMYI